MDEYIKSLKQLSLNQQKAYRLIHSKFPPIALFDDVADKDEFAALFAIQQLTNPRLQNEIGRVNLLPHEQIPYGIIGCSYACAPFTHVNPDGSRFSDGSYGVLYLADNIETALAEVQHHQQKYWQNIEGLRYDTITMRSLSVEFTAQLLDLSDCDHQDFYHPSDYNTARALGAAVKKAQHHGIQYHSVRQSNAICWALMTPKPLKCVQQACHYEFIYDGQSISSVRKISAIG